MLYKKAILSAFCLIPACMMLAQIQSTKQVSIADKIVAVVGDHIILSSEIQNSVKDLNRQGSPVPANAACLVTEQAIISKLLMLQALKDSLPVTDEDVEAELNRRLDYFNKAPGSEIEINIEKIKDQARAQYKEYMLANAMQQKIVDGIRINPSEVKLFFERIPKDSLPVIEPEMEVGQIIFYPAASIDLETYTIIELNNYKKQVEDKGIPFCPSGNNLTACGEREINRNDKNLDPALTSAAFHLKSGEISTPVKCKTGFYLIQMIERRGDDAGVRYIFKPNPVTDIEINEAKAQLNVLRTEIMENRISFNEAASKYTDDNNNGPFLLNQEGSSHITVDQLEKDLAEMISKMNVGEISRPMFFVGDQNKKGVRLIYLKSRTMTHTMNLKDDYLKISQIALEEKKKQALDKWINSKISSYYIMIDAAASAGCPEIQRFASKN